jgi:NAD(P)H-hydrate repair Nnr-like enzyme with NAD(P)H-hydrate epimerase domain
MRSPYHSALGAQIVEAKAAELFAGLVLGAHFPLVITGPLAGQYAVAVAQEMAADEIVAVDIPLGLMSSSALNAVLVDDGPDDALVITNANAAPCEAYGAGVTDRMLTNLGPGDGSGTHIIFAMTAPL